jgi:hypothetical protein
MMRSSISPDAIKSASQSLLLFENAYPCVHTHPIVQIECNRSNAQVDTFWKCASPIIFLVTKSTSLSENNELAMNPTVKNEMEGNSYRTMHNEASLYYIVQRMPNYIQTNAHSIIGK